MVEKYVHLLDGWCEWNCASRRFILGHCYLNQGSPAEKIVVCFTQAAHMTTREDFMLRKILPTVELEEKIVDTVYHIKVIRLLEQFSVPNLVIEYSQSALSFAMAGDTNIPTLWTKIFKHQLELGHQDQAYSAITANPDPEIHHDCLRQFVVVLCDRGQSKDMMQFPYIDLHDEMVAILEERARCIDLETNNYFDLLYSFHTHRGNYRKAASVMYEHASMLAVELPGVESLERQCTCYLATLNTLHIVDTKYQWIVKPVAIILELKLEDLIGASPKRDYDGDPRDKPGSPLSVDETVASLVRVGLFDVAIEVCQSLKVPLNPVFESLALKCVRISRSGADSKTWQWLSANSLSKLHCSKELSPADLAWQLLKVYLERHHCPGDSTHYKVVTTKLLSLGFTLPQWLIRSLKLVDCPSLLRLYISYDKLEDATLLAIELINAVTGELGDGYKDFGMKDPL